MVLTQPGHHTSNRYRLARLHLPHWKMRCDVGFALHQGPWHCREVQTVLPRAKQLTEFERLIPELLFPMGCHSLPDRLRLMSQSTKSQQVLFLHQLQTKRFRPGISELFERTF